MNREFLLNLLFLLAVNLLIKPFYLFGIDRGVQNAVEPGQYGLYFALFNATFLFQVINDLGIQYHNNRSIAQHARLLRRYYPNILVLKALLGFFYLLVVGLFAWLAGYDRALAPMIALLAINQMLVSFIQYMRSNLSGLGLYRTDSFLSVFDRLLLIGVCGLLLWHPAFAGRFEIQWFVWAQTATLLCTALLAIGLLHRRSGWPAIRWRPGMLVLILRRSAPFALLVFLMSIYTRIDGIMVERMMPSGSLEADWYASAFRLLDAGNLLGLLFAGLLFPMFARLLRQGESPQALTRLSMRLIWGASVTLAAGLTAVRAPVMRALYDNGSAYSGDILGFLMLSYIAMSGSYIFGTLLGAAGQMRQLNRLAGAGIVVNVALNLLLIPKYMALGAAAATCFTQTAVWVGQVGLAERHLGLRLGPRLLLRMLLFLALVYGAAWAGATYLPGHWAIKLSASIVLGGCLALIMGLLRISDLQVLWARRSAAS